MGDFDNIKSKSFNYGNEKESSWPSQFGTLDKTPQYWCKETKQMVDGYPPVRETFGVAPTVLFDSMNEEYHHGVCRKISSRKEWEKADRESGSLTLSPREFKNNSENVEARKRAANRELMKDRRKASIEAARFYNENRREFRAKLKARAEQQKEVAKKAGLNKLIKENLK